MGKGPDPGWYAFEGMSIKTSHRNRLRSRWLGFHFGFGCCLAVSPWVSHLETLDCQGSSGEWGHSVPQMGKHSSLTGGLSGMKEVGKYLPLGYELWAVESC
jgi:hypothetical protein